MNKLTFDSTINFEFRIDIVRHEALMNLPKRARGKHRTRRRQVIHERNAHRIPERTKGQSSNSVSRVHLSMQRIRVRDEMACEEAVRVAERTTGRETNADAGTPGRYEEIAECGMWHRGLEVGRGGGDEVAGGCT